jgi:hypothetical protein
MPDKDAPRPRLRGTKLNLDVFPRPIAEPRYPGGLGDRAFFANGIAHNIDLPRKRTTNRELPTS